jgi:hypothetical protein
VNSICYINNSNIEALTPSDNFDLVRQELKEQTDCLF